MNRRGFIAGLFTILPAATSYARIWRSLAKTTMPVEALMSPVDCETISLEWFETDIDFADKKFILKSAIVPGFIDHTTGHWRKCDPPIPYDVNGFMAMQDGHPIDLAGIKILQLHYDCKIGNS